MAAIPNRHTVVINSPNIIPFVIGNIVHTADAVEVKSPRIGISDGMPFDPRTIADGSDSGVRFRSGEGGNFLSFSNVKLVIFDKGRKFIIKETQNPQDEKSDNHNMGE